MLFRLPHPPLCFEIPDEWWKEAGMVGFIPIDSSYPHKPDVLSYIEVLPIAEVAPIIRMPFVQRDFRGFRRDALISVLTGISRQCEMPAVEVVKFPAANVEGYTARLTDGFHRFYASVAAGFTCLPCSIVPNWRALPISPFRESPSDVG